MPWIFCCNTAQTKSGLPCCSLLRHTWPYFPRLQPWSFLACYWPYITECFLGHWFQLKPTWPQCLSHPWKWCHDGFHQSDSAVTFCHRYRWVTICWLDIWQFLNGQRRHLKLRGQVIYSLEMPEVYFECRIFTDFWYFSLVYFVIYKRWIKVVLLPA